MKSRTLAGASALALLVAGGFAGAAAAQDQGTVSEVVVTGSLIRGTPEDAALPVDVIGAEELAKQGTPSAVEMLKALPASAGVLGDSNQFGLGAAGNEGIGSINLRGLGASRTLVLFNGRRVALAGFSGAVDTNMLPLTAVGRIEVLKDGAAVTYGSEAIAGVVNFITPTNFEGFQIDGSYTYIDGSDGGDHSIGAKFGHVWDNGNVFATVNYIHRGMLPIYEKDWANQPLENNPEGGWTISNNPGTFIPLLAGGGLPGIFTRYQRDAHGQLHRTAGPALVDPEPFLKQAAAPGEKIAILGEGIDYHRPALQAADEGRGLITELDRPLWHARAATVHRLAWERAKNSDFDDPRTLLPIYIRLPEAEEVWRKKRESR